MNGATVEMLAWVSVELMSRKPDLDAIREVIDKALESAAKLSIDRDVIAESRRRIAMVAGCDNPLGEMRLMLCGRE